MKYKVTCLECGESDVHSFDETHRLTFSEKILNTPLQGVRWRPDGVMGFRCQCGNSNLLAPEEDKNFKNLVKGDPKSVKKIADSMLIPDEKQFKLEQMTERKK